MPPITTNSSATGPDAKVLSEIENLALVAKDAAHGALAGMHRSLRRGSSIEFSEHKLYSPGDDVRHIDWRAFAKTDRFHIKQFEDETNLRLELIVDHSNSMAFAGESGETQQPSKLDYARTIAGALSYLALRQGDATGLLCFADKVTTELPARASSSHLMEILTRLQALKPGEDTSISTALRHFSQTRKRRTVSVVLTDLFDPNPDLINEFRQLAARRHDVTVIHLLDDAEINFPYDAPSTFASMEDDRKLFVHPRIMRQTFVKEMKNYIEKTRRELRMAGIHYQMVNTNADPGQIIGEFLRQRQSKR